MKKAILLLLILMVGMSSYACITCNKQIQEALFNSTFYPNLFTMLSAFIILAVIVILLSILTEKRHKVYTARYPNEKILSPVPLSTAATVIGIGLGGFFDGIVLHQILQWHEMISNKMPPVNYVAKSVNMFWDGIFHAFCFIVVIVGVVLLWQLLWRKDVDRSGKLFSGGLLVGWGIFNMVEGIVDHHLLKLHNVREITPDKDLWNYGFLGLSAVLLILGFSTINSKKGTNLVET